MNGLHIIANLKGCSFDFSKEHILIDFCIKTCSQHGLHVVGVSSHEFNPQGLTFAILLAESHLCVHTWPEYNSLALDIYTCNHTSDNNEKTKAIYQAIVDFVKPAQQETKILNREDLKLQP